MVRHYFVPGPAQHFVCAISAAAGSVGETTVSARLVTPSDISSAFATGDTSAPSGAINLPAVATSADQHLRPATLAKKEAAGLFAVRPMMVCMTWTRGAVCAIIIRHSCTARCRARRRVDLHVRSALCLPSSINAKTTAPAAAAPSLTPSPESCLGYFPTGPPPMLACAQASIGGGEVPSAEQQAKSLPKNLCVPLGSE